MENKRALEILDAVHSLSKHFHKRDIFGDVTKGEFFILHMITYDGDEHNHEHSHGHEHRHAHMHGRGGVTVTNIARKLNATMGATSKMLRSVEEKGYIERKLDDRDRRVVYIALTEKGEEMIAGAKRQMDDRVDRIIEKVGEEDTAEFLRILRKVTAILQEEE
jgi:Transcriptional regulators